MARKCSTCQHIKRAEIDRRLAAGEPGNQIAARLSGKPVKPAPASGQLPWPGVLQRHHEGGRAGQCGARLSADRKIELGGAYVDLRDRIDQIVRPGRTARLAQGRACPD